MTSQPDVTIQPNPRMIPPTHLLRLWAYQDTYTALHRDGFITYPGSPGARRPLLGPSAILGTCHRVLLAEYIFLDNKLRRANSGLLLMHSGKGTERRTVIFDIALRTTVSHISRRKNDTRVTSGQIKRAPQTFFWGSVT